MVVKSKVKNEAKVIISKSDWKKIVKVFGDKDLKGIISKVDNEKQDLKVKLGEIYEKGFRSGMGFVNDTWQFDYAEQEEYLTRNGEMKKNYGYDGWWDRDIEKEIKRNKRNIK